MSSGPRQTVFNKISEYHDRAKRPVHKIMMGVQFYTDLVNDIDKNNTGGRMCPVEFRNEKSFFIGAFPIEIREDREPNYIGVR
jgi:hypothetical protein